MAKQTKTTRKAPVKKKSAFELKVEWAFEQMPSIDCLYVNFEKEDWRVKESSALARFGEGNYTIVDNPKKK